MIKHFTKVPFLLGNSSNAAVMGKGKVMGERVKVSGRIKGVTRQGQARSSLLVPMHQQNPNILAQIKGKCLNKPTALCPSAVAPILKNCGYSRIMILGIVIKSQSLEFVNVTLFGKTVFADVIVKNLE